MFNLIGGAALITRAATAGISHPPKSTKQNIFKEARKDARCIVLRDSNGSWHAGLCHNSPFNIQIPSQVKTHFSEGEKRCKIYCTYLTLLDHSNLIIMKVDAFQSVIVGRR